MRLTRLTLLLGVLLAGCASPGRDYAARHPELPAGQRQILLTGQVPPGEAIAGMTRAEVTLALGPAARFDNLNGEDVWIYARKTVTAGASSPEVGNAPGSTFSREQGLRQIDPAAPPEAEVFTSIYFRGDRATHAQVGEQKP